MLTLVETPEHPPALAALFKDCASDLTRYFTRRHGDVEVAQDLLQDTFLQLARKLKEGLQTTNARGYIFGIARHLSQAVWSEKARRPSQPLDESANEIPAPATDDRLSFAQETIAALEPIQREILDLRFTQGFSYAEIAEVLRIPIGTVRSRLHHAVAEVRYRIESQS